MPWECVHVDSNGPWTVIINDPVTMPEYKMEIHGLTMVTACTQWADVTVLLNSTEKHSAEKFDQVWLSSNQLSQAHPYSWSVTIVSLKV
jgi:hypothetical protein